MSNRPCNYCEHRRMIRDANAMGAVIVRFQSSSTLGGVDLYQVYPREASPKAKWIAWMMALPDECHC